MKTVRAAVGEVIRTLEAIPVRQAIAENLDPEEIGTALSILSEALEPTREPVA